METLLQDVRYGIRKLLRSPGFTAVAVLTLALGIGANTAIFSVVNGVLLKPLEYRAPERLVFINTQFPTLGFDEFWISPPEYRDLQNHLRSFSDIGAWRTGSASLSGIETPINVNSAIATAELFTTLGVQPQMGRVYTHEEDVLEGPPGVAVISDGLWRGPFAGDPGIVGRTIEINGNPVTVAGVMPPGFDVEDGGIDVYLPTGIPESPTNRGSHYLNLVGRLAPGVTIDQARVEVEGLLGRWGELAGGHVPNDSTHRVLVSGLQEEMVGEIRPALLILLGAVGLVLLIACANVANLLLARAETRQREIAVRSAVGAGRRRLARQFLTESVILSLVGGGLGLLVGHWGLQALLAVSPDSIPRAQEIALDPTVLVFALAVAVVTGLLFGLAPLLHLSPRSMGMALRDGGQRNTAGAGRRRVRRALVVTEVALAVVLVIGSGLLLRSMAALQEVDAGFDAENMLTFQLYLPQSSYPEPADQARFHERLARGIEALPGVEGVVTMTGLPPLREVNANDTEFQDVPQTPDGPAHNVDYYQTVTGNYFETMGIPIVEGRGFTPGDAGGPPVMVINETLARVFYPGESPLGRRMRPCCGDEVPWFTIVGIAKDVKQGGLSERTGTEMYMYYPQIPAALGYAPRTTNVAVRTDRNPMGLADEIRRTVWREDPNLPLAELQTMEENVARSMNRPRFLTLLLSIFAGIALALAAVGTYGVLSYSVAERSKEIGIRMALGAEAPRVQRMVLRDGLGVAALGLVAGLGGALLTTRLMRSMLFGISDMDLTTFLAAPVVLGLVALLASWLPAHRATRVDPMVALREE